MNKTINRVYPTYDEKLVKNTILYLDNQSKKLYFDEAHEYEASAAEVKNLFFKGLIIEYQGGYHIPFSLVATDDTTQVNIFDTEGTPLQCTSTNPATE